MVDRRLFLLAFAAAACAVIYLVAGLRGNIGFVLELRATRLLALLQVGTSIAVSTVILQTVTGNRILTPSIMGLDALYLLGQIVLVFILGGFGYASMAHELKFGAEILLLMMLACALLLPMLRRRVDMGLILLSGVVLGVMLRGLSALFARLIDPNEFAVVQSASFANFNSVRVDLLLVASLLTIIGVIAAWRARHVLDVVALGREAAISLGIAWAPTLVGLMLLVAGLVAVSTALVGPVAFFGLLVVALAERLFASRCHTILLPAASLTAVVILVGGQAIFQHALGNSSALSVVIEFVGGLLFLALLLAENRK